MSKHILRALGSDGSSASIDRPIQSLRNTNRPASLAGVEVVVGDANIDNAGAGQANEVLIMQRFWTAYFIASGAILAEGSHGRRLLRMS